MSRLICLLGLHGSGKTSAGRYLKSNKYVQCHISIGDLARIARSGSVPSDVPVRLILLLAKHKAGTVFARETAELLASYLNELSQKHVCITVDGFPSSGDHVSMLDSDVEIWLFEVDETERLNRLMRRSEETKRKWTRGGPSERDLQLDSTIQRCKDTGMTVKTIQNNKDLAALQESCLRALFDS